MCTVSPRLLLTWIIQTKPTSKCLLFITQSYHRIHKCSQVELRAPKAKLDWCEFTTLKNMWFYYCSTDYNKFACPFSHIFSYSACSLFHDTRCPVSLGRAPWPTPDWHLQQEIKYSIAFAFKVIRHRFPSKVKFSGLPRREAGQGLARQQQDTLC